MRCGCDSPCPGFFDQSGAPKATSSELPDTGIAMDRLQHIGTIFSTEPENFNTLNCKFRPVINVHVAMLSCCCGACCVLSGCCVCCCVLSCCVCCFVVSVAYSIAVLLFLFVILFVVVVVIVTIAVVVALAVAIVVHVAAAVVVAIVVHVAAD